MHRKTLATGILLLFLVGVVNPLSIGISLQEQITIPLSRSSSCPIESPWSMFCHDAQHTGRSIYGMQGKYLREKWRIQIEDGRSFSSPVIDEDETLYFAITAPGNDGTLFAIYSNGTEKWRFSIDEMIGHISPAITDDGNILFGDNQGYFYAVQKNGTLNWKTKLKDAIIS